MNINRYYQIFLLKWVFKVKSTADIRKVFRIVKKHNDLPDGDPKFGDMLEIINFIHTTNPKYPDSYYVVVCSSGGAPAIWKYLEGRYPDKKIIGPEDKIPHDKTNKYEGIQPITIKDERYLKSPFDGEKVKVPKVEFNYDSE